MSTVRVWIVMLAVWMGLGCGTAAAGTVDLTGLWIGATAAETAIQLEVDHLLGSGTLRGNIELQRGDRFQHLAFTGTIQGKEVVLTAPALRLVLTFADGRMIGRMETPGQPDLAVSLMTEGAGPPAAPMVRTEAPPDTVKELLASGWSAIHRDDALDALALFERAAAADPTSAMALYGAGYAHLRLAQDRGGAAHLEPGRASLCRALTFGELDLKQEIEGVLSMRGLSCR